MNLPIRTLVRSLYDLQSLRIQIGNRLVTNFKAKLGVEPSQKEAEGLDAYGKELLDHLRQEYKRLADAVATLNRHLTPAFTAGGLISNPTEYRLVESYVELEQSERKLLKTIEMALKEIPIYVSFLQPTKGVGPTMAGVIISEIDIAKARYPSSLWALAGLDTVLNPATGLHEGRGRKAHHLVDRAYTTKEGTAALRKSITFNPFLKTKLVGVLAPSFLKVGSQEKYAAAYYAYKHRLECHPNWQAATKAHRHNASLRYMIKRFLADLYNAWRPLEGLPVEPPYAEAKLGIVHGGAPAPEADPPLRPSPPPLASESAPPPGM